MASKDRLGKASEAARAAQRNRYVQRLIEDEDLRSNLLSAYGAARSAYGRMSNGKPASKAIFEDRKLQQELKDAVGSLREATSALREPPGKPAPPAWRHRPHAAAASIGAAAGDRPQRGPALEGARPSVRRRGGVRLQLDDGTGDTRAGRRGERLIKTRTGELR